MSDALRLRGGDHGDEHGVLLVLDDGGETVRDDAMLLRLERARELERDSGGGILLLDVGGRAILALGRDLDLGDRGSLLEHELVDRDGEVSCMNLTAACSLNLTAAAACSSRATMKAGCYCSTSAVVRSSNLATTSTSAATPRGSSTSYSTATTCYLNLTAACLLFFPGKSAFEKKCAGSLDWSPLG
jgi:hypothetical protein